MTPEDEEKLIAELIESARAKVFKAQEIAKEAKFKLEREQANLDQIEQAAIDYMLGNGLVECDAFALKVSYAVDVPDVEALPDDFVRTKVTKTANKRLIRDMRPDANWYSMEKNYTVRIK